MLSFVTMQAGPAAADEPSTETAGVVSVLSRGAVGDGVTDDTAAIQSALNSLASGDTLLFPAGKTFVHTDVLRVERPNVTLTGGGTLLATREERSAVYVAADNVQVKQLRFAISNTTKRWVAYEQMKLRLGAKSGIRVTDVTIDGAAAAGVFVGGTRNFVLDRVRVQNTRADGIHITEGARDGVVTSPVVANSGDDGVAIVSYLDFDPVTKVTIADPRVTGQTWGRAFSVVGGNYINWYNLHAERSSSAALYLSSENNYNTHPTHHVVVNGATLSESNQEPSVDHGAIVIFNGQPNTINSDIQIRNVRITNTRPTSSRQVAILNGTNAQHREIAIDNVEITGGPQTNFYSNAPASAYSLTDWTHNGLALPDRGTAKPLDSGGQLVPAGGVVRVPTGAPSSTIMGTLTVTGSQSSGFTTVYACDKPRPGASTNNYVAQQTVANFTSVGTDAQGEFCIYVSSAAHVVFDQTAHTKDINTGAPTRLIDTRQVSATAVQPGQVVRVNTGKPGELVLGNLTVTGTQGRGYTQAWPCTASRPATSINNFEPNQTVPNFAAVVADENGEVCLSTSAAAHLIFDQVTTTTVINAYTPERKVDTRASGQTLGAGQSLALPVAQPGQLVMGNLTVTGPQSAGFTTLWPCEQQRPNASNSNYNAGQTVPIFSAVRADSQGRICVFSTGATDVIWDQNADTDRVTSYKPVRQIDTRD